MLRSTQPAPFTEPSRLGTYMQQQQQRWQQVPQVQRQERQFPCTHPTSTHHKVYWHWKSQHRVFLLAVVLHLHARAAAAAAAAAARVLPHLPRSTPTRRGAPSQLATPATSLGCCPCLHHAAPAVADSPGAGAPCRRQARHSAAQRSHRMTTAPSLQGHMMLHDGDCPCRCRCLCCCCCLLLARY